MFLSLCCFFCSFSSLRCSPLFLPAFPPCPPPPAAATPPHPSARAARNRKVATSTIFHKKLMNALGRKGRSRSKREAKDPPRPVVQADSQPTQTFVNVGLRRWHQQRHDWTSKHPDYIPKRTPTPPPEDRYADSEDLYAALLTPNYQPLPRHVPLAELIVILQEVRGLVD